MDDRGLKKEIHLRQGTMIKGRFNVQQLIGRGGFCYTYRAFDSVLNVDVAIKEFFPHGIASREDGNTVTVFTTADETMFSKGKDRFLKEARNLAQFNKNPNIVSIHDYFEENNTAYIVMEYLEGRDLKKYLGGEGNVLAFEYVKMMADAMCDTLSQVHAAGIIHRDISPDNIFICDDGSIKLIDFGAVKQDFNMNNETVTVILKRGYAPKEQYFSKGKLGPWTDIYALAATLYRLVTGQVPQESIERLEEDLLVPAHLINSEVTENFSHALMKAMSLKIEDRYQTMQDFKAGLNDSSHHPEEYYGWEKYENINGEIPGRNETKALFEDVSLTEDGFDAISEMKESISDTMPQNVQENPDVTPEEKLGENKQTASKMHEENKQTERGIHEERNETAWKTAVLIPQVSIEFSGTIPENGSELDEKPETTNRSPEGSENRSEISDGSGNEENLFSVDKKDTSLKDIPSDTEIKDKPYKENDVKEQKSNGSRIVVLFTIALITVMVCGFWAAYNSGQSKESGSYNRTAESEADISLPADINLGFGKKVKDGFNTATNKTVQVKSYIFSVPDYAVETAKVNEDMDMYSFRLGSNDYATSLSFYYAPNYRYIDNGFDDYIEILNQEIISFAEVSNSVILYKGDYSVNGINMKRVIFAIDNEDDYEFKKSQLEYFFIVDEENQAVYHLSLESNDGSDYNYFPDFHKIIDSIRHE